MLHEKITPQQMNAIHLYYRMVAETLADAGFDIKTILSQGKYMSLPLPVTEDFIKDMYGRGSIMGMYPQLSSHAQLSKDQASKLCETLPEVIESIFDVRIEFPSEEEVKWRLNKK